MKLPYGISNFRKLITEYDFYVDRTQYIEHLEKSGFAYVMFLRPRRFGKSLFISMLEYYYGIDYKAHFSELFGQTFIGQHPTAEANSYKLLSFDFSGIETTTEEKLIQGFLSKVAVGVEEFIDRYATDPASAKARILSQSTPATLLNQFFNVFSSDSIYLLVDEYDHFANEILARDYDQFLQFVARDGFVRKFYEVIKTATRKSIVARLFITGVTPITMDSLTSGFNILKHLSLDERFNAMMGFTAKETHDLIEGLCQQNSTPSGTSLDVMEDLKRWYNGYRFHPKCQERVYNPDMLLHFATAFEIAGNYPDQMIDVNIASDYGKIRRLFQIKNSEQNYQVLERLIKEGTLQSDLTAQFSFEKSFDRQDFISLLFYLGFISIETALLNQLRFSIPNHVIQRLYWDYFITLVKQRFSFNFSTDALNEAMLELAQENRITPFLKLIENALKALSNRDAMNFDEKYVKALFVGFANLANIYFIKSETEIEKKYPDIMLLYRKPILPNYQFIFELKYLKKSEANQLESEVADAQKQLKGYLQSEEVKKLASLKAWVIVFVGDDIGQVKEIFS